MKGIITSTGSFNLQEVAVAKVGHAKFNQRDFKGEDQRIKELAANIAEVGMIHAPTIRKVGDGYECICGARRLEAIKSLGWECCQMNVVECTDAEAIALNTFENFERIDLTLQQEAHSMRQLLDAGVPVAEIAARTGRAAEWIARRINLINLAPEIWEDYESGGASSSASDAVLEELAKLPAALQAEVLHDGAWLFAQEKRMIDHVRNAMNPLGKVKWDKSVPMQTYCGEKPACDGCPFRTDANLDLFASDAKGKAGALCLDPVCYGVKMFTLQQGEFDKLKAKHGVCYWINAGYRDLPREHPAAKGSLNLYMITGIAKKPAKGKVPGVMLGDSDDLRDGQVVWFADPKKKGNSSAPAERVEQAAQVEKPKEKKAKPTLKSLRAELEAARERYNSRWQVEEFREVFIALDTRPEHIKEQELMRLATIYQTQNCLGEVWSGDAWVGYVCDKKESKEDVLNNLWDAVFPELQRHLKQRFESRKEHAQRAAVINFLYYLTGSKEQDVAKIVGERCAKPKTMVKLEAQIAAMEKSKR